MKLGKTVSAALATLLARNVAAKCHSVAGTPSASASSNTTCSSSLNETTPVVDLTYALHAPQITTSPDSNIYYNFSNIRYAAPPVADLRFHAPEDPVNNRSAGVQDGKYGKICPQAYTPWQNSTFVTAPPGEHESEDCLFLDVVVSKSVWEQRCSMSKPVIVWIHGGGYQIGAKYGTPNSNPLGLLDRSFADEGEGVIWIGLNYRVSLGSISRLPSLIIDVSSLVLSGSSKVILSPQPAV